MDDVCESPKVGDLTDDMIFPWLTTERIFGPDEKFPSLKGYEKFYNIMVDNIGTTYAIISMNTDVCISICHIMIDLEYIPDLEHLEKTIDECLATSEQDTPIIAIFLSLVWVEGVKSMDTNKEPIRSTSYPKSFPAYKDVFTGELAAHANILIVDRIEKTLERFEPNVLEQFRIVSTDPHEKRYDSIDSTVKKYIVPLLGSAYTYCAPRSFCPSGGQQSEDEYCGAWSLFYLHLRLTNPNLSRGEIIRRMDRFPRSRPLVIDYLEVLKNTYEALTTGSTIYSRIHRTRLEEYKKAFSGKHLGWIIRYIVRFPHAYMEFLRHIPPSYARSRNKALFWSYLMHGQALWFSPDDSHVRYVAHGRIKL